MSEPLSRHIVMGLGALLLCGPVIATEPGLSDPTRPSGWQRTDTATAPAAQRPVDALRLQGTFSVGGTKSALLSGRRVVVGDEVAGGRVIGIENNKVVLRVDGETMELASVMPVVKSPAVDEGERK